jgi:predicted helicase
MKNKLDFDEISRWGDFENLVADYFKVNKKVKNIKEVRVDPSGKGSDGGRDILVTFRFNDSIDTFERKWVVQCKFHKKAVSNKDLSTVNIPTLVHQYNADGYLLVCRNNVTSNVSKMFEDLNDACKMNYQYTIWTGSIFLTQLYTQRPRPLIQKYFPKYYLFVHSKEGRLRGI